MPGYLAGRAPRNKGMQYPPDPPRPEEIVLVMRQAGHDRHGLRVSAPVAVLWRSGLRISEALAPNETDVDARRGSLLIRHGKGDKRREAGMDQFGFDQLAAWSAHRVSLPPGPLFCVIDGSTRGRRWSATAARAELRQLAVDAGVWAAVRPSSTPQGELLTGSTSRRLMALRAASQRSRSRRTGASPRSPRMPRAAASRCCAAPESAGRLAAIGPNRNEIVALPPPRTGGLTSIPLC